MSELKSYIQIGFDRGEADFAVGAIIEKLSYEDMQKLRAMIPVAIATAERLWAERPGQDVPTLAVQRQA